MSRPDIEVYHVAELDHRKLLGQFLHEQRNESWHQIRRLVEARRVQLNGNLIEDDQKRINKGDVVRVVPHSQARPPKESDCRLQYLDEFCAVIEKPAGMTSIREHSDNAGQKHDKLPTVDEVLPKLMLNGLDKHFDRRVKLPKVFAAHRLDRDTSGLMVFGLTQVAQQHLVAQFRRHSTRRRYTALVHGDCPPQTIESYLAEDRGDGLRGSVTDREKGERAVTHVRLIERIKDFTLIDCRLETGRTHQIRIHLSEAGHMLCGEKLYHRPLGQPVTLDDSGAPRLFLHARSLGFAHPVTGEEMDFEMPLPDDLQEFLDRLKGIRKSKSRDRRST